MLANLKVSTNVNDGLQVPEELLGVSSVPRIIRNFKYLRSLQIPSSRLEYLRMSLQLFIYLEMSSSVFRHLNCLQASFSYFIFSLSLRASKRLKFCLHSIVYKCLQASQVSLSVSIVFKGLQASLRVFKYLKLI